MTKKKVKAKKSHKTPLQFKVFCELVNNEFTNSFKFFIIVKPFLEFCLINNLKFKIDTRLVNCATLQTGSNKRQSCL